MCSSVHEHGQYCRASLTLRIQMHELLLMRNILEINDYIYHQLSIRFCLKTRVMCSDKNLIIPL